MHFFTLIMKYQKEKVKKKSWKVPTKNNKTHMLRTIKHWQRKLKMIGRNGKIVHAFRFEELILLKWPYYPKQSTNLTWSLSKSCQLCIHLGFPDSSVGMESTCNAGGPSSIPGSGWSAGEGIGYPLQYSWASLMAQLVKNLSSMQDTWVWSLGWEDPLEKGKAIHSSILAWRIPWTSPWGSQRVVFHWVIFSLKILITFFFRTRTNNPKIYMKL